MKKRAVSMLLAASMVATMFAGCGNKDGAASSDGNKTAGTETGASDDGASTDDGAGEVADLSQYISGEEEGKVINIYSWNDEARQRICAVYDRVVETNKEGTVTTLDDGTEIHWIVNPNQDGVYQQKLDEALMNQADAAADDKVDIFLSETDYVFKYTDAAADVAIPLSALGITDADLADQYDFTRVVASDATGVQRGSTWQCCPGLLVYRRDIAKDVFGTDDPAEIAKLTSDWETLKGTAQTLKDKGYYTFSSYADTFRLYGNSISESWVADGSSTLKVDPQITNWVADSKEWLDNGYVDKNIKGQWNDDWNSNNS